ncbi:hypothetical protein ACWGID_19915 [Kribbella sp. NPDC054772]
MVRVLAFEATDPPVALATARLTYRLDRTIDPLLKEAELLGDYQLKAELMVGSAATRVRNDAWRPSDFAAMDQIATIHFIGTGVRRFDRLLPYDASWFGALLTILSQASVINSNVKRAIIFLLSQSAASLPFDHVKGLLAHVLPALPDSYEVELASVAACHPALLRETPGPERTLRGPGVGVPTS